MEEKYRTAPPGTKIMKAERIDSLPAGLYARVTRVDGIRHLVYVHNRLILTWLVEEPSFSKLNFFYVQKGVDKATLDSLEHIPRPAPVEPAKWIDSVTSDFINPRIPRKREEE